MCGIFAYIGSEPANIEKIKSLGLYNITRGSDACGIVINDKVSKGISDTSNWSTFCEKNNLKTFKEHDNYIILGHTRQASVRTTKDDIDCAHPIQIKTKKGKVKLIGVHNGTITNIASLAKKYNVKEGKIDSITLMNIISDIKVNPKNDKVFEDYEGGATCLWYYPEEKNVLYLFKGATREKYGAKELKEERPLFMYKESENSIYFSSIKESLYFIGGDINSVSTVPLNQLIRVKIGEKPHIKPIKREKEEDVYVNYNNPVYSHSQCQVPFKTDYKKENEQLKVAKLHKESFEKYNFSRFNQFCTLSNNKLYVLIENEPFILDQEKAGAKVTFWKGRYTRNGHIIGTEKDTYKTLRLDIYGFEKDKSSLEEEDFNDYHFFQGFLFKSKDHADEFFEKGKLDKSFIWTSNDKLNYNNLAMYCFGIIIPKNDKSGNSLLRESKTQNYTFYTGDFTPMFDYGRIYTFGSGNFKKARLVDVTLTNIAKVLDKFEEQSKLNSITPFSKMGASTQQSSEKPSSEQEEKVDNLFQDLMSNFKALIDESEKTDKELSNKLSNMKKVLVRYKTNNSSEKIIVATESGLIYS